MNIGKLSDKPWPNRPVIKDEGQDDATRYKLLAEMRLTNELLKFLIELQIDTDAHSDRAWEYDQRLARIMAAAP